MTFARCPPGGATPLLPLMFSRSAMTGRAAETAVLEVPTSVIPLEKNYLLNPEHPDFKHIRLGKPERF